MLALIAAMLATPLSAEAAVLGPGYEYQGQPGSHLGGYADPDGTISYCINAGAPSTIGKPTTDAGIVDSVNGLDPGTMAQLNQVLSAHGNTADDNTAAAVAMAVWSIAGPAEYAAEGGDNYVLGRAPTSQRDAIRELAAKFRAEAAAYAVPTGSATLSLVVDPTNTALGTLIVQTTAPGSATLTNGVFADTLEATHAIAHGDQLALLGAPPSAEPYRVTAAASFTGPAAPSPNVHLYTTPGSQTLTASGTSKPVSFSASASDDADRLVPLLSTVAQPVGKVGSTVVDTATAVNVPPVGEQLSWHGFLQPSEAAAPVCTSETLVFSSATPLTITADGDYPSERFEVTAAHIGRIFWVMTASIDGVTVYQGKCGEAAEISVLIPAVHLPVVSG